MPRCARHIHDEKSGTPEWRELRVRPAPEKETRPARADTLMRTDIERGVRSVSGMRITVAVISAGEVMGAAYAALLRELGLDVTCFALDKASTWLLAKADIAVIIPEPSNAADDMLRQAVATFRPARTIVAVEAHDMRTRQLALSLRVGGLVTSACTTIALAQACQAARDGRRFIAEELIERRHEPWAASADLSRLSRREMEVMELLVQGLSLRNVASKLTIGYKTVDSHRTSLFRKLGVKNKVELTLLASQFGLTGVPKRNELCITPWRRPAATPPTGPSTPSIENI